jgi:hypothetical protein
MTIDKNLVKQLLTITHQLADSFDDPVVDTAKEITWPESTQELPEEAKGFFEQAYKSANGDDEKKMSAGWKAVQARFKRKDGKQWVKKSLTGVNDSEIDHLRRTLIVDGYPEVAEGIVMNPPMIDLELLPAGYREQILSRFIKAETYKSVDEPKPEINVEIDKEEFQMEFAFKALLDDRKITYGVVYPVNQVDLQKEWAREAVVEGAAHRFMINYRQHDTFHDEQAGKGVTIESYIAPCDIHEFHGRQLSPDQVIKKGSWVMATQWDDETWKLVKDGKIRGYSIGGFKKVRR